MRYEWLIAKRYIWSKRRHPFVGVISTISVIGICVGVAALIVVLAVMNGFDQDLRDRIIGMRAHLVVEKEGAFPEHAQLVDKLRKVPVVKGAAPFVEGQAILQRPDWATGILVRGIDPAAEGSVSRFAAYLKQGALSDRAGGIALGTELARRAGVTLGTQLALISPVSKKPMPVQVEALFSSGMYEYDANLAVLNLKTAQELFGLGDAVSGISVALSDADRADKLKGPLRAALGPSYSVRSWTDMNRTLFGALKLEKIVMFLILALIILVACLNIAGTLTILVMDKTKDIGVLKALGARPSSLMAIFAVDGFLIGAVGALAGLGLGTALCAILDRTSLVELPREIYFVDKLPVQMNLADTLLVMAVGIGLSSVSAFYPAWMAGRLDVVKALRYE